MKRRAADPALWIRGRQQLIMLGVKSLLFNCYRMFLVGADSVLRTPGMSHAEKMLLLKTRVAYAVDKTGLDRKVLKSLLYNVLTFRLEE
jgi:hypothetical protein